MWCWNCCFWFPSSSGEAGSCNGKSLLFPINLRCVLPCSVSSFHFVDVLDPVIMYRKWCRNLFMKGFHLVVLLSDGPGIRDTQVCFCGLVWWSCSFSFTFSSGCVVCCLICCNASICSVALRCWHELVEGKFLQILDWIGICLLSSCSFSAVSKLLVRHEDTIDHLVCSFYLQCRCCFDVEIVYLCKHLRILMVEVSVNWTEIPSSKVPMTRMLHVVFRLVLVKVGYGLRIWKIYS
jgi:hypothetical protein